MAHWKRINPYCIQRGYWSIAKSFDDGCTLYTLSSTADPIDAPCYGVFDNAQDAMARADQLDLAGQP